MSRHESKEEFLSTPQLKEICTNKSKAGPKVKKLKGVFRQFDNEHKSANDKVAAFKEKVIDPIIQYYSNTPKFAEPPENKRNNKKYIENWQERQAAVFVGLDKKLLELANRSSESFLYILNALITNKLYGLVKAFFHRGSAQANTRLVERLTQRNSSNKTLLGISTGLNDDGRMRVLLMAAKNSVSTAPSAEEKEQKNSPAASNTSTPRSRRKNKKTKAKTKVKRTSDTGHRDRRQGDETKRTDQPPIQGWGNTDSSAITVTPAPKQAPQPATETKQAANEAQVGNMQKMLDLAVEKGKLQSALNLAEQRVTELEIKLTASEQRVQQAEAKNSTLHAQNALWQSEMQGLTTKRNQLHEQVSDLQRKLQTASTQLAFFQSNSKEDQQQQRIEQLEKQLATQIQVTADQKQALSDVQAENQRLVQALDRVKAELQAQKPWGAKSSRHLRKSMANTEAESTPASQPILARPVHHRQQRAAQTFATQDWDNSANGEANVPGWDTQPGAPAATGSTNNNSFFSHQFGASANRSRSDAQPQPESKKQPSQQRHHIFNSKHGKGIIATASGEHSNGKQNRRVTVTRIPAKKPAAFRVSGNRATPSTATLADHLPSLGNSNAS